MKILNKTIFVLPAILLFILINFKSYAVTSRQKPHYTDTIKNNISEVNKRYGEAFSKGDSSLFINCYTPDACVMAANIPALCEKGGLLRFFKFAYKSGIRNIVFTTAGLYGQTADYVTEQGNYEMFNSENQSLGKGKYLVLWKKTAEGWRMYRDMFNSDAPPAKPSK